MKKHVFLHNCNGIVNASVFWTPVTLIFKFLQFYLLILTMLVCGFIMFIFTVKKNVVRIMVYFQIKKI